MPISLKLWMHLNISAPIPSFARSSIRFFGIQCFKWFRIFVFQNHFSCVHTSTNKNEQNIKHTLAVLAHCNINECVINCLCLIHDDDEKNKQTNKEVKHSRKKWKKNPNPDAKKNLRTCAIYRMREIVCNNCMMWYYLRIYTVQCAYTYICVIIAAIYIARSSSASASAATVATATAFTHRLVCRFWQTIRTNTSTAKQKTNSKWTFERLLMMAGVSPALDLCFQLFLDSSLTLIEFSLIHIAVRECILHISSVRSIL